MRSLSARPNGERGLAKKGAAFLKKLAPNRAYGAVRAVWRRFRLGPVSSADSGGEALCQEIQTVAKLHGSAIVRQAIREGPFLHLDHYAVVNEPALLSLLRRICYETMDVRAGWFGAGIPRTDRAEDKPLTIWATAHWAMYSGFLSHLGTFGSSPAILDVGCGTGHASACLASLCPGARIVGVDLDRAAISFARTFNQARNIAYVHHDFLNSAFGAHERYDAVFALEVLEHLPATRHFDFVDKCLSLVSEGGVLFLTTPNALEEADSSHGHVGMLNRTRVRSFFSRYKERLVESSFYDNRSLANGNEREFIIHEPWETFSASSGHRSHFRLIFK